MDGLLAVLFITFFWFEGKKTLEGKFRFSLLLPLMFFLISLVLVLGFEQEVEIYGRMVRVVAKDLILLRSLGQLMILNIPTVVLLNLYMKKS